jgi:hypothetical protein
MEPEEVVLEVLARLHASDPRVADLYHEDAVRYGHDGTVMRGRNAIREFYESLFPRRPPLPEVRALFAHAPFVGVLIRLPGATDPPYEYVDLFEVVDGLVRTIRVLLPKAIPERH